MKQKLHGKKKRKPITLADVILYLAFTVFALICVIPFYYIFINTISDNQMVSWGQISILPRGIHFNNYVEVMRQGGLGQAAFISVARTVVGTILTILGSMFLGYAMSRPEYWMHKLWYRFVVVTMYFNAGIIPWFLTMKHLGLTNRFAAYVVPGIVAPFYMILYKTYVESIPASLEESAQLDGAGYLSRFIRIIFPLSKPMLATIAVFTAVGQWNSFNDTLFLIKDTKLFTLQYILYQYLHEAERLAERMRSSSAASMAQANTTLTSTAIRMTTTMVVVFPIMCVYPFFQKYFTKGIMIGAVKG